MSQQELCVEKQNPEVTEPKHLGLGGFMAAGALAIGVMAGPGALIGWHEAESTLSQDRATLLLHEQALPVEKAQVLEGTSEQDAFMGKLSNACAQAVAEYLPSGINQGMDTSSAQVSLQLSGKCPTGDTGLVATARHDTQIVRDESRRLLTDEKQIAAEKYHLAHNNDILEATLIGAAVEVGLIWGAAEWLNTSGSGWEPSVLYQAMGSFDAWADSQPHRKTMAFWKKIFKSRKPQAA